MRLRARAAARPVGELGLTVTFAAGEELRTEISAKFTPERIEGDLAAAGLELVAAVHRSGRPVRAVARRGATGQAPDELTPDREARGADSDAAATPMDEDHDRAAAAARASNGCARPARRGPAPRVLRALGEELVDVARRSTRRTCCSSSRRAARPTATVVLRRRPAPTSTSLAATRARSAAALGRRHAAPAVVPDAGRRRAAARAGRDATACDRRRPAAARRRGRRRARRRRSLAAARRAPWTRGRPARPRARSCDLAGTAIALRDARLAAAHRPAHRLPEPRRDARAPGRGDRPRPRQGTPLAVRPPRPRRLQARQRHHGHPTGDALLRHVGRGAARASTAPSTRSPATAATSSSSILPNARGAARRRRRAPRAAALREIHIARSARAGRGHHGVRRRARSGRSRRGRRGARWSAPTRRCAAARRRARTTSAPRRPSAADAVRPIGPRPGRVPRHEHRRSAALVVGGASGLGEATVRRLHEQRRRRDHRRRQRRARAGARRRARRARFVACRRPRRGRRSRPRSRRPPRPTAGCASRRAAPGTGWAQKIAGSQAARTRSCRSRPSSGST